MEMDQFNTSLYKKQGNRIQWRAIWQFSTPIKRHDDIAFKLLIPSHLGMDLNGYKFDKY